MSSEMILHPRPDVVRDAIKADATAAVCAIMEQQRARPTHDFEVLAGTGQLARLNGASGVQSAIKAWVSQADDGDRRLDIAACLLFGVWAVPIRPDPDLVRALGAALTHSRSTNVEKEKGDVLVALMQAVSIMPDSDEAKRARDVLAALRPNVGASVRDRITQLLSVSPT